MRILVLALAFAIYGAAGGTAATFETSPQPQVRVADLETPRS